MIRHTDKGTYTVELADLDIKSRSGNEIRSTCPLCRDKREHPNDPSLAVNITNGAGICHHCNAHFLVTDYAETLQKKYPVIPEHEKNNEDTDFMEGIRPFDDDCLLFLAKRNIDSKVAERAHVGMKKIHGIPYLAFPFMENGRAVNVQYKRADGREKEFLFEQGGKMIPWNIDCINAETTHGPLYITEGMMDAVALMQSGFQYVVSVPNGSGSKMSVFDKYKELIRKKFTGIIFAGDTDEAGLKLQKNVKEYFKEMDVGTVVWKWRDRDVKDANAMLLAGNTEDVANCIRNARYEDEKDYSVSRIRNSSLWKRYKEGCPHGVGIGIPDVDRILQFLPGNLYVITGYPGSGKSSFVDYAAMSILHTQGWRTLYYTPEKMPEENHLSELVSIVTGKIFDSRVIDETLMTSADEFISGNVIHISEQISDYKKLLSLAAKLIRRHDIKMFVIDPFLYLGINNLNGRSETTRITEMLVDIRHFAQKMNVVMIVVAHPRKPNTAAERPDLMHMMYEVAGSSGFANTCDVGIAIERPSAKEDTMRIMCCKSRYNYLGTLGETKLKYFPNCGRYASLDDDSAPATLFSSWTYDKNTYGRENISDYKSDAPF